MKIENINQQIKMSVFFESDENDREIDIYKLQDVMCIGETLFYPNILFYSQKENKIVNPINEKIMSLSSLDTQIEISEDRIKNMGNDKIIETTPLFFFVYNTDNYFHFIYDTLPYMISFLKLKETIPNIKLLMSYPNSSKKSHYNFVTEFLSILGINENDILLINKETIYNEVYVSTSYTHGVDSNKPPRREIYSFYNTITSQVNDLVKYPKKIYVSRRSWLHGDFNNIGTNYTTRRKMSNEDELIDFLRDNGYVEVFTEKLTTVEKINMFKQATHVIGAIGGGISNVLFSNKNVKLIAIASPTFLDVNKRFVYSLNHVNLSVFNETEHVEKTDLKKYMRVKAGDIVGEITQVLNDEVIISYLNEFVAGWNNELLYKKITVKNELCEKLDNGLNSEWMVNLEKFKKLSL